MSILHDEKSEPIKELGKDEIFDIINDDSDEKADKIELEDKPVKKAVEEKVEEKEEEKEEEKKEEKEEEEIDELEELEDELEEPSEDQLELVTPVRRSEIIAKYPIWKQIIKDFPYLEKAYYREQQFTELLPTIEDAKVAKEKAETLDEFETELRNGDITKVLDSVKKEDKESFNKIADNYLLALSKVDGEAYNNVIGRIINSTIYNMIQEARTLGKDSGGEVLENAAAILNQFVFGTSKFKPTEPLSRKSEEKSDKEKELEERERNHFRQRFETARDTLGTKLENTLKHTISSYIDPKESMTAYVRGKAEADVLTELYKAVERDRRFVVLKDKLWEHAAKNDFDLESMDRIKSAYKSKARTLLPTIIKKARYEALKGMGKRVKEESEAESETSREEKTPSTRRSTSSSNSGRTKPGEIPKGMSNRDFLMSD